MRSSLLFAFIVASWVRSVIALQSASISQRLLERVRRNDRAGEDARTQALPFLVGDKQLGYVLSQSAEIFSKYTDVFSVSHKGLELVDKNEWKDDIAAKRTEALEEVLEDIRKQDIIPALKGWRNEPFAVRETFHSPPDVIVERAAAVLFGVPAYGVFVNGYTCEGKNTKDPTHVWIGKRSATKTTWPGRLDSLAAGGLAAGMLPREAMMMECAEEAGIDGALADGLRAVSAVSYTGYNDDMWGLKRDVLFCFDLELPEDFQPVPVDGEMEKFEKMPIDELVSMLAMPVNEDDSNNQWKPNVGVVMVDFLVRHGIVNVDEPAFLELVDALRGSKCA